MELEAKLMLEDKARRRPLVDPLLLALKSRRVLIAMSALVVSILIGLLPGLATVHEELLTVVIALALALIGGYSLEDAALAARRAASQQPSPQTEHMTGRGVDVPVWVTTPDDEA